MGEYIIEFCDKGIWRLVVNSNTGLPFTFSSIKEAQEEIKKYYVGSFEHGGQIRIREK